MKHLRTLTLMAGLASSFMNSSAFAPPILAKRKNASYQNKKMRKHSKKAKHLQKNAEELL